MAITEFDLTEPYTQTYFAPNGPGTNRLLVPVYDKAANTMEPDKVRVDNSVLAECFSPDELGSLMIVRLPEKTTEADFKLLADFTPADGVARTLAFSTSSTFYFADTDLKSKIGAFFETETDTACRYGSLLTSNCYEHIKSVGNVRVKIVDYKDEETYGHLKTGDCRGIMSSEFAARVKAGLTEEQQANGEPSAPIQFRFAWNKADQNEANLDTSPANSFIAKGTIAIDDEVMQLANDDTNTGNLVDEHLLNSPDSDNQPYDIILDRSSIKGIKKSLLDELLPCGDYTFPRIAFGNRQEAKDNQYKNSWQATICYSPEAIKADFGDATRAAAERLASIQDSPIALRQFILEEHDARQAAKLQTGGSEAGFDPDDFDDFGGETGDETGDSQIEPNMIRLLKADVNGTLLDHPKVAEFMQKTLARAWKELAINGAERWDSGMAQPSRDLNPGEVCIPNLQNGEEVIITRSPIPSSDNIRRYTNRHIPDGMQYKNVVFMNPDDAAKHHQGDFDGDQMVYKRSADWPNIARETKHHSEPKEYGDAGQRAKVSYDDIRDENGKKKYGDLGKIALAAKQNKIGIVASYIGKVKASEPSDKIANNPEELADWKKDQTRLLTRMTKGLQVEVDSGKSAERMEDCSEFGGASLIKSAKDWEQQYPVTFFKAYKLDDLYLKFTLPANGTTSINVLPNLINDSWTETKLFVRERREFQTLMAGDDTRWIAYKEEANEIRNEFDEAKERLRERTDGDNKAFKEGIGELYKSMQTRIEKQFPEAEERSRLHQALWHVQHTDNRDRTEDIKECVKWAETQEPIFEHRQNVRVEDEALAFNAPVLSTPFGKDTAFWKSKLEEKGIKYHAQIRSDVPYVDFVLPNLTERQQTQLEQRFGREITDPESGFIADSDKPGLPDLRQTVQRRGLEIAPPRDYSTWAQPAREGGKAALSFNLCIEEASNRLSTLQVEKLTVIGIKYNDFSDSDFRDPEWKQPFDVQLGKLRFKPSDPQYDKQNGNPCIKTGDNVIGTFGAGQVHLSPGTTLVAQLEEAVPNKKTGEISQVNLKVYPQSLELPVFEFKPGKPAQLKSAEPVIVPLDPTTARIATELIAENQKLAPSAIPDEASTVGAWTVQFDATHITMKDGDKPIMRIDRATNEVVQTLPEEKLRELEAVYAQEETTKQTTQAPQETQEPQEAQKPTTKKRRPVRDYDIDNLTVQSILATIAEPPTKPYTPLPRNSHTGHEL